MTEFSTPKPTKSTPYEPRSLEEKEEAFRLAAILAEEIQKMKESGQIPVKEGLDPNAAGKLNASGDAALAHVTARNKGRVSSGVDPAGLADMTVYGAAIFAAGVVNLAE